MQIISTFTGSETLADASAKVHLFHVTEAREEFISKAPTFTPELVREHGRPVFESAVAGIRQEIGGRWIRNTYEIADEVVMKLYVTRKGGWNELAKSCMVYIQFRDNAALRKITVPLINRPGKSRFAVAELTGRFDILTARQVLAMGVKMNNSALALCSQTAMDATLSVTKLTDALASPVRVVERTTVSSSGEERVVRVRRRVRRLEL